jgi:hypothetical protein
VTRPLPGGPATLPDATAGVPDSRGAQTDLDPTPTSVRTADAGGSSRSSRTVAPSDVTHNNPCSD